MMSDSSRLGIREAGNVVSLPGGETVVGTSHPVIAADGEGPGRRVKLRPSRIGRYAVTNAEFGAFAKATGYLTDAERFGWSYVFYLLLPEDRRAGPVPEGTSWWRVVEGASWHAPEGPDSSVDGRQNHPAVHMSWNDASAFAVWAGGRLPTEAEWEHAARGGLPNPKFPWGDDEPDDETVFCNIWQGRFPDQNTLRDGYLGAAPVDSFAPNGYGLHNMSGNIWEWCADAFRIRSLSKSAKKRNALAAAENERVVKGGSYLCHRSYCYRYRIAARSGRSPDTSAGNTGFRIAFDL